MIASRAFDAAPPKSGARPVATSLFGGAMLATVATASLAQTFHGSVAGLNADSMTAQSVVLGGYHKTGDGGGGLLLKGGTVCTVDNGIVFTDGTFSCFYRADPTFSVREWGAKCDVVSVTSAGTLTAVWTPGSPGTLSVPTAMLVQSPGTGQFIAISQIGQPTLWNESNSGSPGTVSAAVSLTRFSTLGGTQTAYAAGDLISFVGSPGTFSQQPAIIVDAVDKTTGSITQWHFLWGGVFEAGTQPTTAMSQDNTHSYCGTVASAGTLIPCGTLGVATGATLIPAWSGWSVLNNQNITAAGTGYVVGQTVTLSNADGTINQMQFPTLIVENTNGTGGVTGYDWLDYGSFSTLPSNPTTLTAIASGTISGLTFGPVAWTQGPFATTIATVTPSGTLTDIVLTDNPPFPGTMNVQSFYYGDDDYAAINAALASKPASALVIPAGCGTTQPLNLSQDSYGANANPALVRGPALVGGDVQSSGIYAFAYPLGKRTWNSGAPVLSRVLYGGLVDTSTNIGFLSTSGGGFRSMFVEGFGIPEGYGYYGLAGGVGKPTHYVGPVLNFNSGAYSIPLAGSAVEIDAGALVRIDNVHISDGAIGPGNSAFQCGLDESNPTGTISGAVASIVFTNSRLDSNAAILSGSTNPDFAVRVGSSCGGSVFRNLTAYDGGKADVLQYDSNTLSQIHVGSGAVYTSTINGPVTAINWGTVTAGGTFGLAGVADYGVYVIDNTTLAQTQCDIANIACIAIITNPTLSASGSRNGGQITDTQMRCGGFTTVPTGYAGVELRAGAVSTTVGGTAAAGQCAIAPMQLVVLDDPGNTISASLSLCNNSNAPVAGCMGYQGPFAAGQFYTQPAVSFASTGFVLSSDKLYAVPFYSPASGGTITQLGLDVTKAGTATLCRVGIYYAYGGVPSTLIEDGGSISVSSTGTVTGPLTSPVQLAPQTLYFLAVDCNGTVTLENTPLGGALAASLVGSPDYLHPTTRISAASMFGTLPGTFTQGGSINQQTGGAIPNVYAGP